MDLSWLRRECRSARQAWRRGELLSGNGDASRVMKRSGRNGRATPTSRGVANSASMEAPDGASCRSTIHTVASAECSMEMTHDLIVIGGGSGGVAGARRAAAHGAKVAIVEADRFGGTCVIRGCVPKKLMMYAAGFAHQFRDAEGFGWTDVQARFEMPRWADAKKREIDRLERIYDEMLLNAGVEAVRGHGRLVSGNEVDVGGRRLAAPRILIATGGTPSADAFPGLAAAMTSNEVLDLREVPESLLVIGGGYIAVEFASILAALGAQVTLAYRDNSRCAASTPSCAAAS